MWCELRNSARHWLDAIHGPNISTVIIELSLRAARPTAVIGYYVFCFHSNIESGWRLNIIQSGASEYYF